MDVHLVLLGGATHGREIPLPATVFTIGRGQKCHLRINCALVSRQHCALANWGGKVVLRDLNSSNGTFLNDQRVRGEVRIKDGDIVCAGSLRFSVKVKDSSPMGMPIPVVRASEVHWLLDQAGGSSVLKPVETQHLDREQLQEPMDTLVSEAPLGVSAGDWLREFFRPRKP